MAFNEDNLTNLILSTLGEMENDISKPTAPISTRKTDESQTSQLQSIKEIRKPRKVAENKSAIPQKEQLIPIVNTNISGKEIITKTQSEFLIELREKMLVLFDGLQSPDLTNHEDKVDLILNYLEYTLASIDERIDKL